MISEFEEIQFGGKVHSVAEDDLSVSVTDDREGLLIKRLYQEYLQQGKPRNTKAWIRERLKKQFLFCKSPPVWIETRPVWPFRNGEPMVFIDQMEVGETPLINEKLAPRTVLYVFGARIPVEGGWRMEYRVVAQTHDFVKGVVALAKDETALHSGDPKQFTLVRRKREDS